ncbi:hypothetical protein AT1G65483 [Arabidopsis thaliana]|uniref:Uncharacterized protein n=2 Tax=Arabidopsis thaliana TaxID=3702 RepID=Q1G3X9_ARATH|nr:uncharacterized protein AT1G65483 [Arabidopsis thaliana]NP_001154449.1 uncharacterized protein AT1G65483 [Arabidopsis thaliana]ABF59185.1 unknown protein [Arabidopsis thaliana]AEE34383.1 hypothetical protein AT1G65483 [Arabidopsis thaliana]AEE34384.1 hypothetical protein AT1G65483 [Arabidopsis thaliana]|eukprot:NP_001077776.1 hypothetical protein AT1G65483 [Arabidopsis thaliana]
MWTKYLVEYEAEFGAAFVHDVFEDALRQRAKIAPVTVRICWTPSYVTVVGQGGIYQSSVDEIAANVSATSSWCSVR